MRQRNILILMFILEISGKVLSNPENIPYEVDEVRDSREDVSRHLRDCSKPQELVNKDLIHYTARIPMTEKHRQSYQNMNSRMDEVAVSGISVRLPESPTLEEFKRNLLDGVDMLTDAETRWPKGIYGLPTRSGKVANLEYFDALFFGVHPKQTEKMDPQMRMLLEVSVEAILDAGVNPAELRGSKTGVFIGAVGSDSDGYLGNTPDEINGYELIGNCLSLIANRISYCLDLHGPSYAVDAACASGLTALEHAYVAIKFGKCDAAIVGGCSILTNPLRSLQFQCLGTLSPNGVCAPFDVAGNGYVRSEGIVAVFLQKSCVSKRIYYNVLGAKTNSDGYKGDGITFPSGKVQNQLLREVYAESNVDPRDVWYLEAHGTGTKVGDRQELNSVTDFFCKHRKDQPLLIGSVKSNLGHTEAASGLTGLAKMIVALETGLIPANLHYNSPNPDIPALSDGRLQVVTNHAEWQHGFIGVNSFGFGGSNAHVILSPNLKPKSSSVATFPRVVGVSGRTEEAVNFLLDNIQKHKDDADLLALINEIHSADIKSHPFRGYTLLTDEPIRELSQCTGSKRPVWFVYSGMGSQWVGMGNGLMKNDIIKSSIRRSTEVLKPFGIDLEEVVCQDGPHFENILNSFVAIAAMQVMSVSAMHLLTCWSLLESNQMELLDILPVK